eukprot:s1219_g2.t1
MASSKAAGRVLLPPTVEPVKYDIKLVPDLVNFTFDGTEKICLDVREATDESELRCRFIEILLHAKEISIKSHTVVLKAGGTELKPQAVNYNIKDCTLCFKFAEMLPVGEAVLEMEFFGILNNQMAGEAHSALRS